MESNDFTLTPITRTVPDPLRMKLFAWMILRIEQGSLTLHKRTETDSVITHTYQTISSANYDEKIKLIKEGNPITLPVPPHPNDPRRQTTPAWDFINVAKRYLTLLYDKYTGKISLSNFEVGYRWGHKRQKYYPYRKNFPIFSYTNKLYFFTQSRRGKLVMPATGSSIGTEGNQDDMTKDFAKKLFNIQFPTTLPITLEYYIGAKDEYEVIEKRLKVKIPKRLKQVMTPKNLYHILRVLKNVNEITTLNMWVAETDPKFLTVGEYHDQLIPIKKLLSEKMLGQSGHSWLIADWIEDHIKLGRKLSLNVRSHKRITDEHRKMSRLIMYKQVAPLKVHKRYINMFKKWPIENSELITTRERLRKESEMQDHCVATYGNQINSGGCAIISIIYNNERWTLQVQAVNVGDNKYDFRNVQLKGYGNKEAPMQLHAKIDAYLHSIRHRHNNILVQDLEEFPGLPF